MHQQQQFHLHLGTYNMWLRSSVRTVVRTPQHHPLSPSVTETTVDLGKEQVSDGAGYTDAMKTESGTRKYELRRMESARRGLKCVYKIYALIGKNHSGTTNVDVVQNAC